MTTIATAVDTIVAFGIRSHAVRSALRWRTKKSRIAWAVRTPGPTGCSMEGIYRQGESLGLSLHFFRRSHNAQNKMIATKTQTQTTRPGDHADRIGYLKTS